ncbi:MAG: HEAT repeat domain-containing protein [Gammaproteobacteria bacterium]|nr:HEAT repeat domain-containing protein [Gammaproteobacteria bacterium]MDH3806127.1 HEAT repeat domain-containing protein [Gammaproteobacteria bacterium]
MKALFLVAILVAANAECPKWAAADEICPIVGPYEEVWREFYFEGTSEAHLVGILVHAGPKIVPSIIEAIAERQMFARIYAITALGLLKQQEALAPLTDLLNDDTENEYFRSAALKAIYVIDSGAGQIAASELVNNPDSPDSQLKQTAVTVLEHPERIPQEWKRH